MKKVYLNATNLLSGARKLTTCTAILLAGVLVSCSDDDVKNDDDDKVTENSPVALTVLSGASQKGRVQSVVNPRAFAKKERLARVGKIAPLDEKKENQWSATAVAFSEDGKKAYITWHSNKQAKENPAKAWGGAVDIVDASSPALKMIATAYTDGILKFNHVLYTNGNLFLGSTSATDAGVVGRIALTNDEFTTDASVDVIGFPGVSVNAVAKCEDGKLIAVSGYKGTYGTFDPDANAQTYYYGNDSEKQTKNVVSATIGENFDNFGGKYVTTDENGEVYVLHNTENATITKVGGTSVPLGTKLLSALKVAETYDPITKEWVLSTGEHDYYGKHVFAVQDGKAYVACGKNGLVVCDAVTGEVLHKEDLRTTGVCVAGDYVFASTEIGLQVYDWVAGKFHRYAFEVDKYEDGIPASKDSPKTGDDERHSPNFVAVNPVTKDIYVAYGQSGVCVYKFREVKEEAGAEE